MMYEILHIFFVNGYVIDGGFKCFFYVHPENWGR